MKKILITGFEPFGNDKINPSLEAVKLIANRKLIGGEICICQVPVVRFKSIKVVKEAIKEHKPYAVITVGQASGRTAITPERIAINIDDFRIPDNEGIQVIDEPIIADGPDAYFSSLPIKAIVKAMQNNGIPAMISNTAGTFVCNHLFYGIQHYLKDTNIRHGFVHIPLLSEQSLDGTQPTMTLEQIAEGLAISAQAIIDHEEDIQHGAGMIC